ncbi:MAG: PAS domain S-box protein [Burkholderiaceae bacterium]
MKKDAWLWAMPLVAMVLFIMAMAAFLYAIDKQNDIQMRETVIRDVELARQNMRGRLQIVQDRVSQLARDLGQDTVDENGFTLRAREIMSSGREISMMGVMDPQRYARWVRASDTLYQPVLHADNSLIDDAESYWAFEAAAETVRAMYSPPFIGGDGEIYIEIHAPVFIKARFQGTVFAVFPVNGLLTVVLPEDFRQRYLVSIIDGGGNLIASNVSRSIERAKMSYEVSLDPPGQGLRLRAVVYRSTPELAQSMLAWAVVGLSMLIIWSFAMLWRHNKLRSSAERRLVEETKFRRAMENSVMTGMRVLDMHGRITYVNPAFCRMTGYSEIELLDRLPPYPYWPAEHTEHSAHIERLLLGQTPINGIEITVERADGSLFEARLYVSRLLDAGGVQSGWMTSMTDITEPKRIREELSAAQQRFTKVLQEIDAAVSVTDTGTPDILFANRLYEEWFQIQAFKTPACPGEWQQPETGRWFDIRQRTIPWVDGRQVQMRVITDVTLRKQTEETTRQQQEKLQFTSRLVTMGELASSLAHELNQPLTAIANYCMGGVARIKAGTAQAADILPALQKASEQAQRAGNVIRRIREFVKRKAPNRTTCAIGRIVEDAVSLAEIDARNYATVIHMSIEPNLANVQADPILIEQVLLNLIKNAMDAMQTAPVHARRIDITVEKRERQALVSVRDQGTGIDETLKSKIFESFFSTKIEGMGMGLNICLGIIEYHQGRLWMDTSQQKGTIFHFTLPFVEQDVLT